MRPVRSDYFYSTENMMNSEDYPDINHTMEDMTEEETVAEENAEAVREFTADTSSEGSRMDVWLSGCLEDCSRSAVQKLIREGCVYEVKESGNTSNDGLREVKARDRVCRGMRVRVLLPEAEPLTVEPENIPLDILYEDDDLLVVNKPKGMVVHPAPGHTGGTLVNAVLYHCGESLSGINGVLRPGIVHRIDRDTTGALVVCKTDAAHRSLAQQLSVHSITRRYRAVVSGNLSEDTGVIDAPIGRHPTDRKKMSVRSRSPKAAVTEYRVLERLRGACYTECTLRTGRTHQIRVHMSSIGHPLLGDPVYGSGKNPWHLQGQALHAMVLGFVHPSTGEYMEFTAPLPEYFSQLLDKLRKQ